MEKLLRKSIAFYTAKVESCELGILPSELMPLYEKERQRRISKAADYARQNAKTGQSAVAVMVDHKT